MILFEFYLFIFFQEVHSLVLLGLQKRKIDSLKITNPFLGLQKIELIIIIIIIFNESNFWQLVRPRNELI